MAFFSKLFLVVICNLLIVWGRNTSTSLCIPVKQVFDCFASSSDEILSQLATLESLPELYLKGFVFDEVNVAQFSSIISKLRVEEFTFYQCDLNADLASLLVLPSSVKSIHLKHLNLSTKGIQVIVDKLPFGLESLELLSCFNNEQEEQKSNLDLSKFSLLKRISLDISSIGKSDIYELLTSLTTQSLESIKLSWFELDARKLNLVLDEWARKNDGSLLKSLKVFDLEECFIGNRGNDELFKQLLSLPNIQVLSCNTSFCYSNLSLPSLPWTLKQFKLNNFWNIKLSKSKNSIFNFDPVSLPQLTHLTVRGWFKSFPDEIFLLPQLEYLDMLGIECNVIPANDHVCTKLKHLAIRSTHLSFFLPKFKSYFPEIESLKLKIYNSMRFDYIFCHQMFGNSTLKALEIKFQDIPLIEYVCI